MTPGMILLFFLPFLLSLFGGSRRGYPRALCLLSGVMTMLLSVEPYRAALPWTLGMLIAVVSLRERFCPPV